MSRNLEVAAGIGRQLLAEAIWHEDRCNWVGAWPSEGSGGTIAITYSALGPDLYGGTAGLAIFLAELHRATGESEMRRAALGALGQALRAARELPPTVAHSLYSGALGVALAARLVADALGEPVPAPAQELLAIGPVEGGEQDLLGGDAGAVLALLALARLESSREPLAAARAFAANLLALAVAEDETLSWGSRGLPGTPRLAGLSHGASGCSLALLELWHDTGEEDYLRAALAGFAYERSLFDEQAGNWPDLRGQGGTRSFPVLWCHGAPGIALARLRAIELGVGDPVAEEARVALETTRRAVESELAGLGNFSLCHGLAGNAEVLLEGARRLGAERAGDLELALRVAEQGAERHAGSQWPCGTFEGQAPGMFLGLAGIGRFYLRLHDPELPSLLLATPERLAGAAYSSPSCRG